LISFFDSRPPANIFCLSVCGKKTFTKLQKVGGIYIQETKQKTKKKEQSIFLFGSYLLISGAIRKISHQVGQLPLLLITAVLLLRAAFYLACNVI
jgi:hypothetical protein